MATRRYGRVLAIILAAVFAFGCGDNDESGTAGTPAGTPTAVATATLVPASATPPPHPATATATPRQLTSEAVLQRGAWGIGVTTIEFVDSSRPTMPNGTYPGAPTRTLATEIWYPSAPSPSAPQVGTRNAPVAAGPFPLVIYSHGFMDQRTGGAYLARHLASYGYVVAAPDYPLTHRGAPGGPNYLDMAQQPGDVHFLIDEMLGLSAAPGGAFAGAIDAERIGAAGLSLGGSTTFLATFHPTMRDPRIKAAAPLAGGACFLGDEFYADLSIPLLIVHGDIDAIVPFAENAAFAFEQANPPKYLLALKNGSHTSFTDLADPAFAGMNNPDELGCQALSGEFDDGGGRPSLGDVLGGSDAGIIPGDCPQPCTGPTPLPSAMTPARHHQLTILGVFPFFEAYLRQDTDMRLFLEEMLPAENLDVTVQVQR